MQPLSDRTAGFTDSVIRRMTRISNQYGAVNLSQGFPDFDPPKAILDRLAEVSDTHIATYADLLDALDRRHAFFDAQGCRLADHGVSRLPDAACTAAEAATLFSRVRSGQTLGADDAERLQTALLLDLARMNARRGWAQQFHFGPLRNTNSRRFAALGPDTGFDTIGDFRSAEALAHLLDALDSDGQLTRTILYNFIPA